MNVLSQFSVPNHFSFLQIRFYTNDELLLKELSTIEYVLVFGVLNEADGSSKICVGDIGELRTTGSCGISELLRIANSVGVSW